MKTPKGTTLRGNTCIEPSLVVIGLMVCFRGRDKNINKSPAVARGSRPY